MKDIKTEEFITIRELAQMLRVSAKTIYRRIAEKQIQSYPHPLNKKIVIIKRVDIEKLVELKKGIGFAGGN